MFDLDFKIPCKGCSFSFEPDTYPPKDDKDQYCKDCTPVDIDNDIMKGWDN